MRILDPRIREELVAKYGETEDVLAYLRVLEKLPDAADDEDGENHHMLHRSAFPRYSNLNANPWNKLRIHRGVHAGLTELQARFDTRLRVIALRMKGLSVEAHLEMCSKAGKIGGKRTQELYPNLMSEIGKEGGKIGGKIAGKIAVESGQLAKVRRPDLGKVYGKIYGPINGKANVESGHLARICSSGGKTGGKIQGKKNVESGHLAKIRCLRWNIRRGKPCTCGRHLQAAAQVAGN